MSLLLPNLISDLQVTQAERRELNREAALLEQKEKTLKQQIYEVLGEPQTDGTYHGVGVKIDQDYKIDNYPALEQYIRDTGSVDLLQKRLTPSAVKFRIDDGQTIPGIVAVQSYKLNLEP